MPSTRAEPPGPGNDWHAAHATLLCDSFRRCTGRELLEPRPSPAQLGLALYEAPFAVLSHGGGGEPSFTYANRRALAAFEADWSGLVGMPSRLSAEAPDREERQRLLEETARRGFVEGYAGTRVTLTGRRFRIEDAVLWNLVDAGGQVCGQAAAIRRIAD